MTRDTEAIWSPSPNYGFPYQGNSGRMGQRPQWIILHSTAGGGAVEWLCNPASGVSAHYVIKQDGSIYQLVDEGDASWANGVLEAGHDPWWLVTTNPNLVTISIEHEKPDKTNQIALTPAQQAASFGLIQRICQRWNIPMRQADASGGITGHYSITPINRKDCPGTYPWADLWAFLGGDVNTTYGPKSADFNQYFTVANGNWTSKQTGNVLQGGNLALYQQLSIDGNTLPVIGLPRSNELYQHDPNGYSWSVQFFERGCIVYDPQFKHDRQPGMGASYLGKQEQFEHLDPAYKALDPVMISSDAVKADIQTIVSLVSQVGSALNTAVQQLTKDAGL